MLTYDEFKEAIDRGYISNSDIMIVRKNGLIFDYVLPDEEVRDYETVTIEKVADVLRELAQ
ncbi:competence regulator inhibitor paratox [Streptococcus phocae subsp. phocae]